jgi:uncharacterized protein (DUF885 family)
MMLDFTPFNNPFSEILEVIMDPNIQPLKNRRDINRLRQRMIGFRKAMKSLTEKLTEGIKHSITQPKIIVEALINELILIKNTKPYLKICTKPVFVNIMNRLYLQPLVEMIGFLQAQYLPYSRSKLGLCGLPGRIGERIYQYQINLYSNQFGLKPDQIHRMGLAETETILDKTENLRETLENPNFESDPSFYPKSTSEIMEKYRSLIKKIDKEVLPPNFKKLKPRQKCRVEQTPSYLEDTKATAYYQPSVGKKAGIFYVNLKNIHDHPLYLAESLCCHEVNPGHHFQISLSKDLDVAPFRRYFNWDAFKEGWALYAEKLAPYSNPYSRMGHFREDLLRASRLIIDTGIHSLGWDLTKCTKFLSALFPNNSDYWINQCIIRYVSQPGQALCYKLGEFVFLEARKKYVEKAGISLVRFHQQLMKLGPVPIHLIDEYLDKEFN